MIATAIFFTLILIQFLLGFYMMIKFNREAGYENCKAKEIGIEEETEFLLAMSSVLLPIVGILISGYSYLKIKEMRKL